jgi:CDP-diacylglycerol--serine O-phosphatidyltransferase
MPIGPRKDLPLTRLLPNMLTVMSLCSGLTAMRFALENEYDHAVLAIVLAGIFDMLDGRVARLLNIASKFGAELDSLADAINFGVAPGFVMYLWILKDDPRLGWVAVLVFAVCMALRLARFNTMIEDTTAPSWRKKYFTGVPAPGGAGLAILPLVFVLEFGEQARLPATVISVWLLVLAMLLVSRLPTPSIKGWRVKLAWVAPVFAAAVFFAAVIINNTWLVLSAVGIVYIISLPIGWYRYLRQKKREDAASGTLTNV